MRCLYPLLLLFVFPYFGCKARLDEREIEPTKKEASQTNTAIGDPDESRVWAEREASHMRKFESTRIVGVEKCADCHLKEAEVWRDSWHNKTTRIDKSARARAIARRLGIEGSIKESRLCQTCHYTTQGQQRHVIAGVSCESCHGPAQKWVEIHADTKLGKSERRQLAQNFGMNHPGHIYTIVENCYQCHFIPNEPLVNTAGHPRHTPGFELLSSLSKIRHNFLSGGLQRTISQPRKRMLFIIGRGLELEYALRGLARATEKQGSYAKKMRQRIQRARKRLGKLAELTNLREIDEVHQIAVTLDYQRDELLPIADKVKSILVTLSQQYRGDESGLAAVDALLSQE